MVTGRSATRYPRHNALIKSSDVWYCGWFKVTFAVTSARIAR